MRASAMAVTTVGLLVISMPSGLDSCAWAEPSHVFVTSQRPADLNEFLKGKIGVLQRTYGRNYLIGGFRILSGAPLTETEAHSIYNFVPGADLPHNNWGYIEQAGFDAWHTARQAVAKLGAAPHIEAHKAIKAPGLIQSFRNCNDDAFEVAAESLAEVSANWGEEDERTLDWVRAQDEVFANCSSDEPVIPDDPTAGADPLFAAYRRYQIAAALLYSGQSRKASLAFDRIAKDEESPWRGYGPYLAARALLRAGTFDGDQAAFNEGKQRLLAILNDPGQDEWHEPSIKLLHAWEVRAEPDARLAELGRELMKPTDDADVGQSVFDFLYLLNKGERTTTPEKYQSELAEREKSSELAAWLLSMSAKAPSRSVRGGQSKTAGLLSDAADQSVAWWRKTRNPAWLISALLNASDKDVPELVEAARQVSPSAAAYESLTYYAISREIDQGHQQEARLWADRALSHNLQRSTRNLILAQRTMLARSWQEFLRYGLRTPEPHILWDNTENNGEFYVDKAVDKAEDTSPTYDIDVSVNFDGAPLSVWMDAANNMQVPARFRLGIAQAGWLRAVVLGKDEESREFMRRVVTLQPASAQIANGFLYARDHEELKFAAIYLYLRNPSLYPNFGSGGTDLANAHYLNGRTCWSVGGTISSDLTFPTLAQRLASQAELARFMAAAPWDATYLARQAVAWAQNHPDDPRVPEALHRAVMASRYRCTDANTGTYSKQAFDLLHRQYSKSVWTARTPYWYK